MSDVLGVPTGAVVVPWGPRPERAGRPVLRRRDERGMVSAEWAVGIIAAVAIAGVLLAVVTNGRVETALLEFILSVIRGFAQG
ncbi:MAG: hypothetical protein AVDCRST_MAG75-1971 [uncultured Propionibacteriaceae bacterium]|uniref:DUF4244 domain-containing protein n=1 Tax=uncultured Propionibacteriaceae bacterium TaxID=257457 RepID=A0A6J4P2L5_9ACTN|nr:MAG: hypothetical protein AVDCRST_MAG75-1971 [uncultured Propionibacteriaceae bacterium]